MSKKYEAGTELKVSRVLHAGYLLEHGETQVLFDPIFESPFSYNCYSFPAVSFDLAKIRNLKLTAVFISHHHDDHFSLKSLNLLNRDTSIYMYCQHLEAFDWLKRLGFKKVFSLDLGEAITVGTLQITPLRALNELVDSIFHIQFSDLNILNLVDSWIHPETWQQLLTINDWDLIMWPFQTMREIEVLSPRRYQMCTQEIPQESLDQIKQLNPKRLIPSSCQFQFESWSWYNQAYFPISYQRFEKEISLKVPKTQVLRLDPSETVILNGNTFEKGIPLDWVIPLSQNKVDYIFDPTISVPSTSEIAKHLQHVDEIIRNRVLEYCQYEMLSQFHSLQVGLSFDFPSPWCWQVVLYDHVDQKDIFWYEINGDQIKLLDQPKAEISWLTEIPMVKLFAALEKGENLNSIYIRVNDCVFDDKTERALSNSDPLEDPLLCCLYSEKFGTYQKTQLIQLLENK